MAKGRVTIRENAIQDGIKTSALLAKRVPPPVRKALDETGLPWWIEVGGSHLKIRLQGRLVGILPKAGKPSERKQCVNFNLASSIRKMANEIRTAG